MPPRLGLKRYGSTDGSCWPRGKNAHEFRGAYLGQRYDPVGALQASEMEKEGTDETTGCDWMRWERRA